MTGLENSHLVEPTIENTVERGHHKPGKANFMSVSSLTAIFNDTMSRREVNGQTVSHIV